MLALTQLQFVEILVPWFMAIGLIIVSLRSFSFVGRTTIERRPWRAVTTPVSAMIGKTLRLVSYE
jgi:hypothetical protein